ncbi:MAG: glycosyltransferase [Gammaproteobacteria bacterium]
MPQTVVSLTPVPVSQDSRAFKIAATLAACGLRSVVVEAAGGARVPGGYFDVVTAAGAGGPAGSGTAAVPGALERVAGWARFLRSYFRRHVLGPLRVMPRASVYYLHGPYQFPAVFIACLRYGSRFVYDIHDFYPLVDPHRLYRWLDRQCVRRAAAVVTVSDGIAGMVESAYGRRPEVVRNCHDARLDAAPPAGLRATLGLGDEVFLLVSIGHGGKSGQAVPEAVRALRMLPGHVHLALVGRGHEDCIALARSIGVQARVHAVDPVAPNAVVPFVAGADASLVLYFPENADYLHALPNKLFQSIAAGLPVLYDPSLPEIARIVSGPGIGVQVDPRSPESIAGGVRVVLDPRRREVLKRRTDDAREALSWEAEERGLISTLGRVMGVTLRRGSP